MSRPPKVIRPVKLTTSIPEDLYLKLKLYLWSDAEQRVPLGAFQRFICERIIEFFSKE
jgi:hypothetical protein